MNNSNCEYTDDIPMKRCTGPCGQEYLATAEYWNHSKNGKYGLNSRCKECSRQIAKALYHTSEQKEKKRAYYEAHKEQKLAYDKERRQRNAEQIRVAKKISYHKHATSILEQKREYYQRNKEQIYAYRSRPDVKERSKAKAKEHREQPEIKERTRARQEAYRSRPDVKERDRAKRKVYYSNPEVKARYRAWERERRLHPQWTEHVRQKDHRRRSRHMAVSGRHTAAQLREQLKRQKHKCYYCQKRLQKVKGKYIYHVEHTFPLSRVAGSDIPANDISYLVLACPSCNISKGDKFPWEFPEGGRLL